MTRRYCLLSILGLLVQCGAASAQTPGALYTWSGTGDTAEWLAVPPTANTQAASLANTTPGVLTITELGIHDDINGIDLHGGALLISDGYNRLRDTSPVIGGLDLTGLDMLEMDVSHTGSGNINVQMYTQVGAGSTFIAWNQPDLAMEPNVNYTLQFPLSLLTPEQKAYVRTIGVQSRDHAAVGDVIWNISEVRSVGTALTVRDLATHDGGTSDGGLNGAICNFECNAIAGGDGGQNQTGFSHNAAGSGSLKWTDKGNNGVAANPSGAAVSWANGTTYGGNTFFERPADVSNYNFLIMRMSATDVLNRGGNIGTQGWFQTGAFSFRVAGSGSFFYNLPIDGQYHDLVYPIAFGGPNVAIQDRQYAQAFGVNLFSHPNDADINVDNVRFINFQGIPGDFNNDGAVNARDYVVLRKYMNTSTTLPNDITPGSVTPEDFIIWRYFFASPPGSGSLADSGTVPEPATVTLAILAAIGALVARRRRA